MALLRLSRRELLLAGVAGAGAFGVGVYGGFRLGRRDERRRRIVPPREQAFAPSAMVAIDETGLVSIWLTKSELGQGVATALPMLIAEELGADPARIRVVLAPANECYGSQFTAVSSSVKGHWLELRGAGAAAREMLIAAAAEGFAVPATQCVAADGAVVHQASGRRLPFAALVRAAARQPVPTTPALKQPAEFRWVGKQMPRLDHAAKVYGSARFGHDVRLAGMAFAVVQRAPVFGGGKVEGFDATAALQVEGVLDVFAIDSGVVVLAATTHAAMRGREVLQVTFEQGANVDWSSERVNALMVELADRDGAIARQEGRGVAGLQGEGTLVEAEYRTPYLAHATMETMNCTADVRADGCSVYVPTQNPIGARDTAARLLGLAPDQVTVQPTWAGGGFGRRVADDFVIEAVQASRHAGRPVQVVWTREDDFAQDHYRPCSLHRMAARLGADGLPVAWSHRVVTPSILAQDPRFEDPVDPVAVEGAKEVPYAIDDLQVELVKVPAPFPLGFWRSVGHSFNAFAVECFVDEIAVAGGRSAAEVRRALLQRPAQAAHLGVLELALANAGEPPLAPGKGRGLAVHASFGSVVAMVADVRVVDGVVRVERITAAVDCGFAVHPDGVVAQIEGAVAFALSAVFFGEVRFEGGAAAISNFHDQGLLRCDAMPQVRVHIVSRAVPPEQLGGVGEIGVPPVAPAVANAVYAATGQRVRRLPMVLG